jgi:hypothetical protein
MGIRHVVDSQNQCTEILNHQTIERAGLSGFFFFFVPRFGLPSCKQEVGPFEGYETKIAQNNNKKKSSIYPHALVKTWFIDYNCIIYLLIGSFSNNRSKGRRTRFSSRQWRWS